MYEAYLTFLICQSSHELLDSQRHPQLRVRILDKARKLLAHEFHEACVHAQGDYHVNFPTRQERILFRARYVCATVHPFAKA